MAGIGVGSVDEGKVVRVPRLCFLTKLVRLATPMRGFLVAVRSDAR